MEQAKKMVLVVSHYILDQINKNNVYEHEKMLEKSNIVQ